MFCKAARYSSGKGDNMRQVDGGYSVLTLYTDQRCGFGHSGPSLAGCFSQLT